MPRVKEKKKRERNTQRRRIKRDRCRIVLIEVDLAAVEGGEERKSWPITPSAEAGGGDISLLFPVGGEGRGGKRKGKKGDAPKKPPIAIGKKDIWFSLFSFERSCGGGGEKKEKKKGKKRTIETGSQGRDLVEHFL